MLVRDTEMYAKPYRACKMRRRSEIYAVLHAKRYTWVSVAKSRSRPIVSLETHLATQFQIIDEIWTDHIAKSRGSSDVVIDLMSLEHL
jgi:hypothetical protein